MVINSNIYTLPAPLGRDFVHPPEADWALFKSMVMKNGKIIELKKDPLPYPDFDWTNKFIIPSFIESHCHILENGLLEIFPNLTQTKTLGQVFDAILTAYPKAKEYKFLMGFNLDPEKIKEMRLPTGKEVTRVIPDYPLIVHRIDGHSGALNQMALEKIFAGKVVEGMEFNSYKEPTGIVRGKAYETALRFFKRLLNPDIKIESFYKTCELALRKGITTLVGLVGDEEDSETVEILLRVKDNFPIEVIPFYQTKSVERIRRLGLKRIGGCILIDGSLGSHTAALSEDYEDEFGNKGILYFSDKELLTFLKENNDAGLQTAVHAIGDRAIEQVVSCYEQILKEGNPLRHRIEHCVVLTDRLIERIARLGLIVSVQPAFEHFWGGEGKMYEKRLGKRATLTNSFRKLVESQILVCGGSDAPITPLDPVLGIKTLISHPRKGLSVNFHQALKIFTQNGAYAIFEEDRLGLLKEGSDANFLVLEEDPFVTNDFKIHSVWRNGKILNSARGATE